MTAEQLLGFLDKLGIETNTVQHAPVFTVEQAQEHREGLSGGFAKNLFLRNKKGKMWLVVAREECPINLKALGRGIGAGHLSFASRQRLETYLGVEPGSVTPFGLVHDTERVVTLVIDRGLLAHSRLNFHPLDNARTTAIAADDLLTFFKATGHQPQLFDLDEFAPR